LLRISDTCILVHGDETYASVCGGSRDRFQKFESRRNRRTEWRALAIAQGGRFMVVANYVG
jgi:hypothetical protein